MMPVSNISRKTTTLDSYKKDNGVVYTPSSLALYVAEKVVGYFLEDITGSKKEDRLKRLRIIDPACGEGELLTASWQALHNQINESDMEGLLDARSTLCGVDLDRNSIFKTAKKIDQLNPLDRRRKHNLLSTNALFPENKTLNVSGWEPLKKTYNAETGFDILIANPPWGANVSSYEDKLTDRFTLKKGQYDSSDLFVELSLSLVKEGGYFAFIIPDSLFGFERINLRKLLLENSEIKFIGRLGEKIFEGVNRACVVLIAQKNQPIKNNFVTCMRLSPELRRDILDGNLSYEKAESKVAHKVRQSRFSENEELLFDIDTKEEEKRVLNKISSSNEVIGNHVSSARGVELSKTGKIYKCLACDNWSPLPSTEKSKCMHCGASISLSKIEVVTIISKKKFKGSKPILVGESIRRYSISSRLWISVDNKGINYKSISLYYEPKILVRKTGVGITATIDYSNALTNQVVYMFKPRSDVDNPIPIEFVLAIMNSRTVYYYLLKKYGETEWRSHPYLTQSQVLSLPLPNLSSVEAKSVQKKIAKLLRPYLEAGKDISESLDAKVEFLIASMFGLSKKDYEVIYKTLDSTQGLIPVKELSTISVSDIFK